MLTITFILQSIIYWPVQGLLRLYGFKVAQHPDWKKVKAQRGKRGLLIVANHQSHVDPPAIAATLPFLSALQPVFYVSLPKDAYKHMSFGFLCGGTLFKMFGAYAAYKGLGDYEKALIQHIKLLKQGKTVVLFPEGKIHRDFLGEARQGVQHLAAITNALILPVGISGHETDLTMRVGEPVEYTGQSAQEILELVRPLVTYAI